MKIHGDPLLAATMAKKATLERQEATEAETPHESHGVENVGDPLLEAVQQHHSQQGERRDVARMPLSPRVSVTELRGHGDPLMKVVVDSWDPNDDGKMVETKENRDTVMVAHGGIRKSHGDPFFKATTMVR